MNTYIITYAHPHAKTDTDILIRREREKKQKTKEKLSRFFFFFLLTRVLGTTAERSSHKTPQLQPAAPPPLPGALPVSTTNSLASHAEKNKQVVLFSFTTD